MKKNSNFHDLRIYASQIDISLLAKHLEENESIIMVSISFNNFKTSDAEYIIEIIKKLKNLKEF
jgi:hypothetical protein